MSVQQDAIRAIEAQQAAVKPRSPQWMVGEQLKDICRREPKSAELIVQDLKVEDMSITAVEKKIKAFADKHKTGNFSCVTSDEADGILRKFYGLPKPQDMPPELGTAADRPQGYEGPAPVPTPEPPASGWKPVDLMDFL